MKSTRFLFVAAFSLTFFSQCGSLHKSGSEGNTHREIESLVDKHPEYPGGLKQMARDVAENFEYPEQAREDGIGGRVTVKFVVNENGRIEDIEIMSGVREDLDQAAVEAVKKLKRWKPAVKDGKNVSVSYHLPVNAMLSNE